MEKKCGSSALAPIKRNAILNSQSSHYKPFPSPTHVRLQPGRKTPIPHGGFQVHDMPVHEKDGTAPSVAWHRAAPIGVIAGDPAGVRSVIARVVEDPTAGFFRRGIGHALERVRGVQRFATTIS